MPMLRDRLGSRFVAAWFLSIAWIAATSALAQDLEVWQDQRKYELRSRDRNGESYYPIRDLARIFELQFQEVDTQLRITGTRSTVAVFDGRPIVRVGDQYLLLSAGVWKRGPNDWYLPYSFVEKALPGILTDRLTWKGDSAIYVEKLGENKLRVDVISFRDHISVVFRLGQSARSKVTDFQDQLEVEFEGYLVRPEYIEQSPDVGLLSSIDFLTEEGLGVFHLKKGDKFSRFREYQLGNPPRLVLDLYGNEDYVVLGSSPDASTSGDQQQARSVIDVGPFGSGATEDDSRQDSESSEGWIVIDPGHGGEDYGVDLSQADLEKDIAYNIARDAEEDLTRAGHKTRLTRFRDVSLASDQRSAVANYYKAKLYVGIHIGGSPSGQTRGPAVYVFAPGPRRAAESVQTPSQSGGATSPPLPVEERLKLLRWEEAQTGFIPESKRFARILQDELNSVFQVENRVSEVRLAVLAPIMAPAVVIEAGFLTNSQDRELLMDREFQERIAESIRRSVTTFLGN